MAKALQVFLHSDLRCGHEGLAAIAKKEKINVNKLAVGEYVIFINTERNKVKLYAANNVVAYLKLPRGHIEMRTISLIPKAFAASGRIDYDELLRETLEGALLRRNRHVNADRTPQAQAQ